MVINVKQTVISMQNTYELYQNRLTIKDNEDDEIIIIEGIDLEDLKEFLKIT